MQITKSSSYFSKDRSDLISLLFEQKSLLKQRWLLGGKKSYGDLKDFQEFVSPHYSLPLILSLIHTLSFLGFMLISFLLVFLLSISLLLRFVLNCIIIYYSIVPLDLSSAHSLSFSLFLLSFSLSFSISLSLLFPYILFEWQNLFEYHPSDWDKSYSNEKVKNETAIK